MSYSIELPSARFEVLLAVASLSDVEYQKLVWIDRSMPADSYRDSLDMNIHTLFDDWTVLPEPESFVGSILVAGAEITRLRILGEILGQLIDDLGDGTDIAYLQHAGWPSVVRAAGSALSAMVINMALINRNWSGP